MAEVVATSAKTAAATVKVAEYLIGVEIAGVGGNDVSCETSAVLVLSAATVTAVVKVAKYSVGLETAGVGESDVSYETSAAMAVAVAAAIPAKPAALLSPSKPPIPPLKQTQISAKTAAENSV